jgi:crotonobetainyl-CoA:carnitine CoA-transferase CaiB-like acyl-CoA transferase
VWADYQYTGSLQARGQSDLLPASDGRVMIGWHTSVPWDRFAIAMDAMELVTDPDLQPPAIMGRSSDKYRATLSKHTPTRTRREWLGTAIEHGLPAGMLQSLDDVAVCEQLEARRFWNRIATPSGRYAPFPGTFYCVDGETKVGECVVAPRLGEHNQEVYEALGRTREELRQLRAEGAI